MTSRVFAKLLGLFTVLLVFVTLVMETVLYGLVEHQEPDTLRDIGPLVFWSGLIALVIAIPLAAWIAASASARLRRVVAFARRIAEGDLAARIDATGDDEISTVEAALNQTAERLGKDFAELQSGRDELAVMLDSLQEAVVAITPSGLVRWSNAAMQRIAGAQLPPAARSYTRFAIPNFWPVCAARWNAVNSA